MNAIRLSSCPPETLQGPRRRKKDRVVDVPSPLEVLLVAMNHYWRLAQVDKAVALAKVAAPYVHAKASSRDALPDDVGAIEDNKLDEFCRSSAERAGFSAKTSE